MYPRWVCWPASAMVVDDISYDFVQSLLLSQCSCAVEVLPWKMLDRDMHISYPKNQPIPSRLLVLHTRARVGDNSTYTTYLAATTITSSQGGTAAVVLDSEHADRFAAATTPLQSTPLGGKGGEVS